MLASKYGRPSTHEEVPRCEDPTTMNVRILGNPYKLHKQNEAKVMDRAKKKIVAKFDRLQIEAQYVLEVRESILVRLTGSIVHKIFGIEA